MSKRINVASGAKWEDLVGYSRVVRLGNHLEVSGTVSVKEGKDKPFESTANNPIFKGNVSFAAAAAAASFAEDLAAAADKAAVAVAAYAALKKLAHPIPEEFPDIQASYTGEKTGTYTI